MSAKFSISAGAVAMVVLVTPTLASALTASHRNASLPRERGSAVGSGVNERGPYTPNIPTPAHGRSGDFQNGSRG